MRSIHRLAIGSAVLAALAAHALGVTVIVERTSALAKPPIDQRLLLRELARQATLIAAERAGATTIDRTLAPSAAAPADALAIDVEQTWQTSGPFAMTVRRDDQPIAGTRMRLLQGPGRTIPYDAVATHLAGEIDAQFVGAFRAIVEAAPPATQPIAAPADAGALWREVVTLREAATLRDVAPMLARVNAFDAFRAARRLHALRNADDGPSPAVLSALARAYANLGDATRPLVSAHFDAAFARALLYAELLVARRPDDALSYWTRAYVRAQLTLTSAREDVARARGLDADADGPPPPWAALVESFVEGDVVALSAVVKADGEQSPLAAHLAMRLTEFGDLSPVAIHFGEIAAEQDDADLRARLVVSDHSPAGEQDEVTAATPRALNRAFDAVAEWPELPASLRPTFGAARLREYDADARLALWRKLDAADAADGPLPWATLADLGREFTVVVAQRRLDYVFSRRPRDLGDEYRAWRPVVQDHPAGAVVASYANVVDKARLAAIPTSDLHASFRPFTWQLGRAGVPNDATGRPWWQSIDKHFDRVPYELESNVWLYRGEDNADYLRDMTRRLYEASPDDLVALESMVRWQIDGIGERAAELRERARVAPSLAWQLAKRTLETNPKAGAELLDEVLSVAPSFRVYLTVANLYDRRGDIDALVATYDRFLREGAGTAVQSADAGSRAARALIDDGQVERALPYARRAADYRRSWGLTIYAANLLELGRFDEARRTMREEYERYEDNPYERYFLGVVYPPIADAKHAEAIRLLAAGWAGSKDDEERRRAPVVLMADGKLDEAAAVLARSTDAAQGSFGMTAFLAIVQLMRGDDAAIGPALDALAAATDKDDPKDASNAAHREAAGMVKAILAGGPPPAATPNRELQRFAYAAAETTRAADACLIGLACERRGHREAAEAWYRRAIRCGGIGPGRAAAAIRLRAMGAGATRPTQ